MLGADGRKTDRPPLQVLGDRLRHLACLLRDFSVYLFSIDSLGQFVFVHDVSSSTETTSIWRST